MSAATSQSLLSSFNWEGGVPELFRAEKPLHQIEKLVIKGHVDVVIYRGDTPYMEVACSNKEALAQIGFKLSSNKLTISNQSTGFSSGGVQMAGVNLGVMVAGRSIVIQRGDGSTTQVFHGSVENFEGTARCMVGIILPQAPQVKIEGSGDVSVYDIQQDAIRFKVHGSGDISASGRVGCLKVEIAGSGDVDASDLVAEKAILCVAGHGDIEAHVTAEVHAQVAGSGDIVVRGNPSIRDHRVAGSGKIKFR